MLSPYTITGRNHSYSRTVPQSLTHPISYLPPLPLGSGLRLGLRLIEELFRLALPFPLSPPPLPPAPLLGGGDRDRDGEREYDRSRLLLAGAGDLDRDSEREMLRARLLSGSLAFPLFAPLLGPPPLLGGGGERERDGDRLSYLLRPPPRLAGGERERLE